MKTNPDIILINPTLTYEELYGGVSRRAETTMFPSGFPTCRLDQENGYKAEIIDGIATQISTENIIKAILEKNPRSSGSPAYRYRYLRQRK